eukprot:g2547.t1
MAGRATLERYRLALFLLTYVGIVLSSSLRGSDTASRSFHIFVCFHSDLRDNMYAAEGAFDPRFFTFVKVNPALPLRVPQALRDRAGGGLRILHEAQLQLSRPELQRMGFLESSCQYHVAANRAYTRESLGYDPDYVGFLQYDMRLPPHFVRDMHRLIRHGGAKHISFGNVDRYMFDWAGGVGAHPAGWMLLPFNRRDGWIDADGSVAAASLVQTSRLMANGGYGALRTLPYGLRGALYNSTLDYFLKAFNAFERDTAKAASANEPPLLKGEPECALRDHKGTGPPATRGDLLSLRRLNLYNSYLLPVRSFERMLQWSSVCFFDKPVAFARAVSFTKDSTSANETEVLMHGLRGVQWGHLGGMMERAHAIWMALALRDIEYVSAHVFHEPNAHSYSMFHPDAWSLATWLHSSFISLQGVGSVLVLGLLLTRLRCSRALCACICRGRCGSRQKANRRKKWRKQGN